MLIDERKSEHTSEPLPRPHSHKISPGTQISGSVRAGKLSPCETEVKIITVIKTVHPHIL